LQTECKLVVILVLVLATAPSVYSKSDPNTHVIRMLHIGKAWLMPYTPGPTFVKDPRISWNPVPAHAWSMGEKAAQRNLRLYMPRSQEELREKYDVVVEDGMFATDMPPRFIRWLIDEMKSSGIGFLMADDSSSFATSGSHPSWYLTPIGDILPVNDKPGLYGPPEQFHCLPQIPGHPLTRDLPWNQVWISSSNKPWPKQGSTVVALMSPTVPVNNGKAYMCFWKMGKGISFAYVHKWHINEGTFYRWPYHEDVLVHLIYFTAQEPIPDDVMQEHRVRGLFDKVYQQRLYLLSFIEFADKFGANLRQVEVGLAEDSKLYDEARQSFIDADMDSCTSQLNRLSDSYAQLTELAFHLWNRAIFWVHVVEWLVVTGTSMLAGGLLWLLMVRRKLYREITSTRIVRSDR